MAFTKHKLTTNQDKITGGAGSDLFLAPLVGLSKSPTLGSDDRLDGGAGIDTLRATIDDVLAAPVLKSIERGIFTVAEVATIPLDLANAKQMHSVTVKSGDTLDGALVEIGNATGVTSLAIQTDADQTYAMDGLDATAHDSFRLTVDGETQSDIELDSDGNKQFADFTVVLKNAADITLSGTCVNAKNLTINSTASSGQIDNHLELDPGMHTGEISNLTITGDQNLTLYTSSDSFRHLTSFDSTGMSAIVWASFGGDALASVKGGNGTEIIDISAIGGTAGHKASVTLGGGHDYLTLKYAFDSATQAYNGGKGVDTITLEGVAANLNDAAVNFENVHVNHASGLYDVTGMKLVNFLLLSTSSAVTIDGLADDATLGIYEDLTTYLTVNTAHAASSTTESLRLLLQNSADVGNSVVGFMAPSLTNLQIDCYSGDHVMYLTSIGSATDAATLTISGATHLDLNATNGSTSYIQSLVITSDAGADIYGLVNGTQAFVSTGATITGGKGDDVLVGGAGADTINSGAGNNTIHGSGGIDTINLALNSGADVLVFHAISESLPNGFEDVVNNFSAFDTIDLSDMVSSLTFNGNVASKSTGISGLSTAHTSGFFVTTDHMLYIDVNHDGAIDTSHDFALYLDGVSGLNSGNLIG